MSRDLERCPTTGALVDACRHCADDLPFDTPEHDDPEETPMPATPPPTEPEVPDEVCAAVTLTWTAHVCCPRRLLDQLAQLHGVKADDMVVLAAASRIHREARFRGQPRPRVVDPRLVVSAVNLVDSDVQALS